MAWTTPMTYTAGAILTAAQQNTYVSNNLTAVRDNMIPAATVMVFFQAAAPTGWTQVTTQNNKQMRVVSGTGAGTGGTGSVTSPPTHQHDMDVDGTPRTDVLETGATIMRIGNVSSGKMVAYVSGGALSRNEVLSRTAVIAHGVTAYVDVIICSKDSW